MVSAASTLAGLPGRARSCIRSSGLAQREVARLIGLDETKLSKSLKGTRRFTPDELTRLATVTGATANWLLSGSDAAEGASAAPSAHILPTRHHENEEQAQKRRAIIEKSWWMFAEKGYAAVRIADIAREVGVSPAAVHYYFPTKREIFAEALRFSIKLAFDRQISELHSITDPVARLKRLMELQLPAGASGRAEWSIWLQTWSQVAVDSTGQENHTQGYQRWTQTVQAIIAEGQAAGVFRGTDPLTATMDVTTMMDGLGIKVLTRILTTDQMHQHIESFIDRNIVNHSNAQRTTTNHKEASYEP